MIKIGSSYVVNQLYSNDNPILENTWVDELLIGIPSIILRGFLGMIIADSRNTYQK